MLLFLKTYSLFVFLLFWAINSALAQKQEADTTHHDLGEVVIDGQQIKRLRSSMPIQQFDAKEIKSLNANNVSDVAKHLAGVSVKDYGGIGGVKTVSVRGLGAAHTGVCYDGFMVNDIQTGQIDVGKFILENITDISLSNGHPNDFFHSARTFGTSSLLSINSTSFKNDSTNPFCGKATLKAGSFGYMNPSIILKKGYAKKWSAIFSLDGISANGEYKFNEYNINKTEVISVKNRVNGDVNSIKTEVKVVGYLKEYETLSFKSSFYSSERGIPGPNILYSTYSKDRMLNKDYLFQAHYKNKQSCIFQYQIQGSANRAFMRYSAVDPKYSTLLNNTQIDEYLQNEYYLSGSAQYYPFDRLSVTSSVDYIYNDLTSESNLFEQYNSSPIRNTLLANVAAKYFTNRLLVGANVLYTATYESSSENVAPDRSKLAPTISFSYKLFYNMDLRIRGFFKNIYRLPTFVELYYHDFGYTELRPEITNQYNFGVIYGEKRLWVLSDLEFSLDGYYNDVTDKIVVKWGNPFSTVRNVGQVIVQGIDVGFKTRLTLSKKSGFNVHLNYSYQIAEDRTTGSENYGEQIPYTPFNSGAGSIGYSYRVFDVGYNLIYSGIRWDGTNVKDNKLDAYAEHSLYAKCAYKKFTLMGEVINFMDMQYDVIKNYPMPGRNYRLTMSYTF